MIIIQKKQKNKKITEILLSIFFICFFNFIHSQIYIPKGVIFFVEKSTVVTQDFANAISATGSASQERSEEKQESGIRKTSVTKRVRTKRIKKNILELSKKIKQQALKNQKPKTITFVILRGGSNENFTTPSASEKPIIFPDHHLEWEIPKIVNTFDSSYLFENNKYFYTSPHSLIPTNTSFRTRPPPFSWI